MAQLLSFTESDLLGSVTHVDTEQIIIEIENPLIMTQICVGNLVAIETGKHHELLISLIDKVTRKYVDDFNDGEEDVNEIMISSADYVKVSIIGTYHSVFGNARDIFKRGVDTFPQIESKCFCISGLNLQNFMNVLSRNIDSDKRLKIGSFMMDASADRQHHRTDHPQQAELDGIPSHRRAAVQIPIRRAGYDLCPATGCKSLCRI